MRSTSASSFRKNLATELDRVAKDREPLIIHRNGDKPAMVLVPLADFKEVDETDYLLSDPLNAARLLRSIRDADEGKLIDVPWPE